MNVLFIGDVVGRPGRKTVAKWLPSLKTQFSVDIAIANAENAAGGLGATAETLDELVAAGVDAFTLGNHTWRKKAFASAIDRYEIVIYDKVHFETAKAVIKPESFGLLNDVASIIITNPDLGRVEVAGHTDSQGSDAYNLKLSQRRAESVVNYLIQGGVEPQRLMAQGYGESTPIDTNETTEGKARNRRVEFTIKDKANGGETGKTWGM